MQTRWLYASDSSLLGLPGAAAYIVVDGTFTPLATPPTGDTFNVYEVQPVPGAGSWWLPTAQQSLVPQPWIDAPGGVVDLAASGGIWTAVSHGGLVEPVQRPALVLWWIPDGALAYLPEQPGGVNGAVQGAFPTVAPPAPAPTPPPPDDDGDGDDDEPGGGEEGNAWRSRAEYNVALRAGPQRPPPRTEVVRAYRDRARAARAQAIPVRPPGHNWTPFGPSVALRGQGATQPDVSGRITGIAVAASGKRLYVGAANGGVWRSDDGGASFTPTMDMLDLRPTVGLADALAVGAIALHPAHPDRVYVGSGEAPGGVFNAQREGTMYFGVGALVTDDGGRSWRRELMEPPPPPGHGSAFYALAVDPGDPERVLAATMSGLYRREPRNADQFADQVPPQAYFIRYTPATRDAYAHYWSADGLTAPRAAWGGAAQLPEANAALVSFAVDGEPWFLSYAPGNGNFNLFRVGGDSVPVQIANGNWPTNLTALPVTLGGDPYLVLYRAADGATWLKRLGRAPGYAIADAWNPAQAAWPANLTSLATLAADGVPLLLRYAAGAGTAQLLQWNTDLTVTQIWQENWDPALTLAGFQLRGRPFYLRWKADGSAGLYGLDAGLRPRRVWADGAGTWAAGATFIPFPFDDREHFLAYRANDGWTSLNTLGVATGRRTNLWTTFWPTDVVTMPFAMGYRWQQRLAGNVTGVALGADGETAIAWAVRHGGETLSSSDLGRTWHRSRQVLLPDAGRVTLAMQPTNPFVAYASTQTGLVFRTDGGQTPFVWRQVWNIPADYVRGQGNYDLALAVAPDDPDRIYVGGCWVRSPTPGVAAGDECVGAIYRCDLDASGSVVAAQPAFIGNAVHADVHTFAFQPAPPHDLWVGCDGGLFRSQRPTGLRDVDIFTARNAGLATMTMGHLGQHPTEDAVLFAGTQDNGNLRALGDEAWLHWAPGDSGYVVVNRGTPANVISTGYNSGRDANNWLRASTNGGERFPGNFVYRRVPTLQGEPMLFYAPLVGTPASAGAGAVTNLLAFGTSRPWISTDFGVTWASIPANGVADFLSTPPTANDRITAMAFSPDASQLLVGTIDGRIFRYAFAGGWGAKQALNGIAGGPLPAAAVTGFAFDAANPGAMWVSFGGTLGNPNHVWYLNAAGNLWAARGGGGASTLLDIHYNAIVADPANANTVYVGGDLGVWRTTDGGATWTPFAEGLPEAAVIDLALFPANAGRQAPAILRVATFGRGVWERILDNGARYHRPVQLYIRKTLLDRGLYPVVDGVASPLNPLAPSVTNHRYGPDIKLVQQAGGAWPASSTIDFAQYTRLVEPANLARNQPARVYVQVHNRGVVPARDVKVSIAVSRLINGAPPPPPIVGAPFPPALPDSYWDRIDDGFPLGNADWSSVTVATIPEVRAGEPIVVAGDLTAAQLTAAGLYAIVAIVSCREDRFTSHQRNLDTLTINEPQAAMRYVTTL